jgi:outer membrane protein assembly factor BamA
VTEIDEGSNDARFIAEDRPYGTGTFSQLGAGATLRIDTRDMALAATRGVYFELGGNGYPRFADVDRAFGEVHGRVATYLTPKGPGSPTLALQLGAKKVFATKDSLPFHEAAFLGSPSTLRGYRDHRFAGDRGAVYGSAELRLPLTHAFILVPGRQGILAFYDFGRVYQRGEVSDTWYHSYGGGVWLGFLTRGSVLSLTFGHGDEGNDKVYVRAGFAF